MESKLRRLYAQLSQLNYFRELTDRQKRDVLVRQYIAVELQTNHCVEIVNNGGEVLSSTELKAIYGLSPVDHQNHFKQSATEVIERRNANQNKSEVVLVEIDTSKLVQAQYSWISPKRKLMGYCCQYPGCDYAQRKKSSVQSHVNETHTGIPTFKCNYCGVYFRDNNERNKHKKIHKKSY